MIYGKLWQSLLFCCWSGFLQHCEWWQDLWPWAAHLCQSDPCPLYSEISSLGLHCIPACACACACVHLPLLRHALSAHSPVTKPPFLPSTFCESRLLNGTKAFLAIHLSCLLTPLTGCCAPASHSLLVLPNFQAITASSLTTVLFHVTSSDVGSTGLTRY